VPPFGNIPWNWVADFGNGSPTINPASFTVTSAGLDETVDLIDILPLSNLLETNTDNLANFGGHVQETATRENSEAIGGLYVEQAPPAMPEPGSMFIWAALIAGAFGVLPLGRHAAR
jgi:hypothetical protein